MFDKKREKCIMVVEIVLKNKIFVFYFSTFLKEEKKE